MSWRTQVILALLASLFLLGLGKAGVLDVPRTALTGVLLSPLQVGWYRMGQAATERFAVLGQIGRLGQDNLTLRAENDRLKSDLAVLGEVQKDNASLRQQLGTPATSGYQLTVASIAGYVPSIGTKELLLTSGSLAGLKVGQVAVSGNVVLGKIASVQPDRSTLRLLTDPQSQVIAVTSRGAKGILIGQFQSSSKLTKLLQNESINVGDSILTTGEGDWPARLVIGEIAQVIKHDNELFQEAEVRTLVNYDRLKLVYVITGSK